MSLWGNIKNALAKRAYPGVTARITLSDPETMQSLITGLFGGQGIAAKFPFEIYRLMDDLFLVDPYLSKYLHTTLALGNTGHSLEITAATEKQAQAAIQAANDLAARCYPFGGGMDGAVNGLFSQICRGGGLCGEWPPDEKLTQVARLYLAPIRSIRFRPNEAGDLELCQLQQGQMAPLNPVQTTFHAVSTLDGNPYPVPPGMSALKGLAKLAKADRSLDKWLDKLALVGMLLGSVERPDQKGGESDEAYDQRASGILNGIAKSISDNLKHGFGLAYDNVEMKFTNTAAGAAGAKDLLQIVLQAVFAGLGRDPVFFGYNWNTTETFAKVVFEELIGGIHTFQLAVKRAIEHGHRLNFALGGLGDVGVSAQFNENRSLDAFIGSEAALMEGQRYQKDFELGIADREEVRKLLGYDDQAASADAFIASFSRANNVYRLQPRKRRTWPGAKITSSRDVEYFGSQVENTARDARNAARRYIFQAQDQLSAAGQIGVQAVYEWARVRDIPEEEIFVQEALQRFSAGAEGSLTAATLEEIAKEHITKIWRWARYEDNTLFGPDWDRQTGGVGTILGEVDHRAIDYMSRVDRFYTSSYVSGDVRTSQQISSFLREQYLEKGLGRDKKGLAAFKEEFSDLTERIGENRARVIVDTGVSRAQNWGEVYALTDERVTTYKIAGPWDTTTCEWCRAMRGKEYSVVSDKARIDSIISSGDEDIAKFDSFITSRFAGAGGLTELQGLSGAEVQATGMANPPIHPLCRHRLIAVIVTKSGNVYRIYERAPILVGSYEYAHAA